MSEINYDAAKLWWDVVQTLGTLAVAVYVWNKSRDQAHTHAINQQKHALGEVEDQLLSISEQIKHGPRPEDISQLHRRVDEVGQALNNVEGRLGEMNKTLHLIQSHLLTAGNDTL